MPDTAGRMRRLNELAREVAALDITVEAKTLRAKVTALQQRAIAALGEIRRGNRTNIEFAREKASAANRKRGKASKERLLPIIKQLREQGVKTYAAIAKELTLLKIRPPVADTWSPSSVRHIENQ